MSRVKGYAKADDYQQQPAIRFHSHTLLQASLYNLSLQSTSIELYTV